jgi:hypothetical protein
MSNTFHRILLKNSKKKLKNTTQYMLQIEDAYIERKYVKYYDYISLIFIKHYDFKNNGNQRNKFNTYLHHNEEDFLILITFVKKYNMVINNKQKEDLEYIFTFGGNEIDDIFIIDFEKIKQKIKTLQHYTKTINNISTCHISLRKKSYSANKTNELLINEFFKNTENKCNSLTALFMLKTINNK